MASPSSQHDDVGFENGTDDAETLVRATSSPPEGEPRRLSGLVLRIRSWTGPSLVDGDDDDTQHVSGVQPHVPELTEVACHAQTVADTVRAAFGTRRLDDYVLEMTAPEQTTNGGLQALQHISLRLRGGSAIVVGTVNVIENVVELRPYEHVSRACSARFKCKPSFDNVAYLAFLEGATQVLENFGLSVRFNDQAEAPSDVVATVAPTSASPAVVGVLIALNVAIGAAIFALLR
jgi:hypothetical protein